MLSAEAPAVHVIMEVLDNPLDVFNAFVPGVLYQEELDTLEAVLDPDAAATHLNLEERWGLELIKGLEVLMLQFDFVLKLLQELELLEIMAAVAPVESMILIEGFFESLVVPARCEVHEVPLDDTVLPCVGLDFLEGHWVIFNAQDHLDVRDCFGARDC